MSIPQRQLQRWTKQGAVNNSKRTYSSIKAALASERSALSQFNHDYETYLQGSYKNYTNIHGVSDVDVVVRLLSTWKRDLSELSSSEQQAYHDAYSSADYSVRGFRRDVYKSLYRYYGLGNVDRGTKAIKVESNDETPLRVDADVVPCCEYRKYHYFNSKDDQGYTSGMAFYTQDTNRLIINYSNEHYENGKEKNRLAGGDYKATIRMMKNARNKMRRAGIIQKGVAPSYFIEGLLYNVPHSSFKKAYLPYRYDNIVSRLETADIGPFDEQSKMYPLCDSSDPDRWNAAHARTFVNGLRQLWNQW